MTLDEFAAKLGGPGAAPEEIAAFEALVGFPLPDDYRRFLSRTGGGGLPKEVEVFFGEGGDLDEYIARLDGLSGPNALTREVREPSWGRLADGLIAIGDGRGGDPIALCLREDRRGQVFLIDHEVMPYDADEQGADASHSVEQAQDYGYLISLASSFTGFVENLGADKDP